MDSEDNKEIQKSVCPQRLLKIIGSDQEISSDDSRVSSNSSTSPIEINTRNVSKNPILVDRTDIGTSTKRQMQSTVGTTTDTVTVRTTTTNTETETETNPISSTQTSVTQNEPSVSVQRTSQPCANVVTIPVPIVQSEENYTYITIKGSLHDHSCAVFGLDETEIQALSKRFDNGVKQVVNGIMVTIPPMDMVNTMAQLSYKVVCSCGEAEICWTMQREI